MWGSLTSVLVLSLMAATSVCGGETTPLLGCPLGKQQVISYNGSLLNPNNITASDEDTNINPDDYLFHRNNVPLRLWCSQPLTNRTNNSGERIALSSIVREQEKTFSIGVELSRPLLITQIGSSGFSNGFVSNFSMQYASESNTIVYTQLDLNNKQEFLVPKIDTVFTLAHPFVADQLKFQINDGLVSPSGRICWHLTLFGCPEEDVITKQPILPETTISSLQRSTPVPSPSKTSCVQLITTTYIQEQVSQSPTVEVPTPNTVVVRDYQILVIVVPAAVATILVVLCIVAVGVCICLYNHGDDGWKNHKNGFRGSQLLSTSSNTLRIVENGTLYQSNSPLLPLATDRDISENTRKPIYENVPREPLPSKESGYYEPVNPISESDDSLASNESMVDNPTYSVPFPVGTPRSGLGPLPPIPPQWNGELHGPKSVIPMVNNECYRAPGQQEDVEMSISQSYSNRLPNDYETPL